MNIKCCLCRRSLVYVYERNTDAFLLQLQHYKNDVECFEFITFTDCLIFYILK